MDASRPERVSLLAGQGDSSHDIRPASIPRRPVPRQTTATAPTDGVPRTSDQIGGHRQDTNPDTGDYPDHAVDYQPPNDRGDKARGRAVGRKSKSLIWLRKATLISFSVAFVAFIGALIAVWAANRVQKGFSIALAPNHYAWTYGPTAILVIVLSLWRQIDYYCKLMQPWHQLHKGPTDAESSALLDYIEPMIPVSFFKAIRSGHWAVVASIMGFALLKLIILFSTGMLVLTPTPEHKTRPVILTTAFDGDSCVPKESVFVPLVVYPIPPLATYNNPDMYPLYTYTGVRDGQIRTPEGIDGDIVYQSFKPATDSVGINDTSVDVEVVRPALQCETADAKVLDSQQILFTTAHTPNVQLTTETCSLGSDVQNDPWWIPADSAPHGWQLDYQLQRIECPNGAKSDNRSNTLDTNFTKDIRYAMIVSNLSVESSTSINNGGFQTFSDAYPQASVKQITAIFCHLEYNTGNATLVRDPTQSSLALSNITANGHWSNFTNVMLGEMVSSILLKADQQALLLKSLPGNATLENLMDAKVLTKAATNVWNGITTQYLQRNCLLPAQINSTGMANLMEDRLHVSLVSIWVMVACFIALIGCAFAVMRTTVPALLPRDPSSVSTAAMILAASPSMQEVLRESGGLRTSQLTERLRHYKFGILTDDGCELHATAKKEFDQGQHKNQDEPAKKKKGIWAPLAAKYYMLATTLAVPLLAIAALEWIYQVSQSRNGIADITGGEESASYVSRILTALTMFGIASTFNSLDFTISSFAPYSLMRSGNVGRYRSIDFHILGRLPPVALWKSIRARHFSSALSNACGIIGSVLTIIASGLWVIDRTVLANQALQASLTSTWDTRWQNSSAAGDGGAAAMMDRIDHGGASMPSSIWRNHVMPGVGGVRLSAANHSQGSMLNNYTLELDALRPSLSCEIVPDEQVDIMAFEWSYSGSDNGSLHFEPVWDPSSDPVNSILARPKLGTNCNRAGSAGQRDYYIYGASTQYDFATLGSWTAAAPDPNAGGPKNSTWMGHSFDLHLGPWSLPANFTSVTESFVSNDIWNNQVLSPRNDSQDFGELDVNLQFQKDNPAGCPSIGVVFANMTKNATTHEDVTVLLCSQQIEQVRLRVTFNGSSTVHPLMNLDIDPVPIAGTSRLLTNGTPGIESFPYRPQAYLDPHSDGSGALAWPGTAHTDLDGFFRHIINKPNGTKLEDMVGRANQDTLINAVQDAYAQYMSLVIDMKFRQNITAEESLASPVNGSILSYRSRLQMAYGSKLTLQIMLGVMVLLGGMAFLLTDLRGTLPRKSTSIASTMAFLAGSDLCSGQKALLPGDALWMKEKHLDTLFDGWLFSLGWWSRQANLVRTLSQGDSGDEDGNRGGAENAGDEHAVEGGKVERWFGIDVGAPEQLGFRERRDWRPEWLRDKRWPRWVRTKQG